MLTTCWNILLRIKIAFAFICRFSSMAKVWKYLRASTVEMSGLPQLTLKPDPNPTEFNFTEFFVFKNLIRMGSDQVSQNLDPLQSPGSMIGVFPIRAFTYFLESKARLGKCCEVTAILPECCCFQRPMNLNGNTFSISNGFTTGEHDSVWV